MKGIDLVKRFEQFAPKDIAVKGDPVGLQIGSLNKDINKVMTTLDVRPEVVDEAINNHVDFIFAHHPVMFRPAKNLDLSIPQNAMYAKLIKHDITVYAAHTNLDNAVGGMNDWLASALNLSDVQGLSFMFNKYDQDFYMGRVGELTSESTVIEFANTCKKIFNIKGLRLISNTPTKKIKKVAILGGDGGKFYHDAMHKHADVYITGDVYYHTGHDMLADGISVIDPGHHIESICKKQLLKLFNTWNQQYNWGIDIVDSQINTDPFTFI
ncbi:Nif3-like dinuclear metal center hexameric protein [Apilactobacillus xinyiensis]|uniref:GTP cyclohydrolase 1 type 2 homolog n=1 Tax=Apilactobacillus xinyiensis TaxID=2841032 RepID=A0ABT0HZR7_9LACO|nr:Nif3-like dinuclear metal center hexameric protein [Apilactobacillus xinyiensis]MCK8624070.1 Nif3-like dinuclear metal center hexameric protein [Apilactobacillus xinyiensis]MCL0318193.1 Nif3-like dinuclear metal center hexameric protein [Apilactobacillus xinyiensis]MCL0329348.1 Nif3-like dinuclear metal center hexameric protein [Apilactobacillus xinyiensis]